MAPKSAAPVAAAAAACSSSLPAALPTLTCAFIAWKALILLLSLGALVGPDYDTSTSLLFSLLRSSSSSSSSSPPSSLGATLAARLTRWDAIYFVHGARAGYVYEQEWAFSPTLALALRWVAGRTRVLLAIPAGEGEHLEALAGVALAHASHGVAVFAVYRLTLLLSGSNKRLALLAGLLCVVSPAGVFLSAPYAEAPFSALSFVAVWALAAGYQRARGIAGAQPGGARGGRGAGPGDGDPQQRARERPALRGRGPAGGGCVCADAGRRSGGRRGSGGRGRHLGGSGERHPAVCCL